MNKDKIIKDLKERNDKLANQYRLRDIRCVHLERENERLKEIASKMHLWIFLNSSDEQKIYDELGLTDSENKMLGYSGQLWLGDDKE